MATQAIGRDHAAAWERHRAASTAQTNEEAPAVSESAFRGLIYAVLFEVCVAVAGFGLWELWRHVL